MQFIQPICGTDVLPICFSDKCAETNRFYVIEIISQRKCFQFKIVLLYI
jgi:hypothetical protein